MDDPRLHGLLATLTRDCNDWIAVVSPQGAYRLSLGAVDRMLGYSHAELFEHGFLHGIDAALEPRISQKLVELEARPDTPLSAVYRRQRKNGSWIEVRSTFVNRIAERSIRGIVVTTTAVGCTSGMAGLDEFRSRLKAIVEMRTRPYALTVVNLKNLPRVAAALGHSATDRLAERVARRLQAAVGPGHVIGQLGSQQFAVLVEGEEDEGRARATADKIYGRLRAPFRIDGRDVVLNPSLGFVTNRRGYENADDVISNALSAAQRAGGGRSRMFQSEMLKEDRRRLEIAAALPAALAGGQLQTRYQPIVDLASGDIVGAEALMRWKHPELGFVPPSEFIPVAEGADWIIPFDRWMLERVTRQVMSWSSRVRVSVNLSGRHLEDPSLPDTVARALRDSGLPAELLRLEVTETAMAADARACADALQGIRQLGVTLAIDDFGTGYSSFAQLADLPFDVLKVDRSMVMRLDGQAGGRNVVPGIVSMAHQLGLEVVAEGIETTAQRDALRDLDCEYGQGYLFSKPITVPELQALLAAGTHR